MEIKEKTKNKEIKMDGAELRASWNTHIRKPNIGG